MMLETIPIIRSDLADERSPLLSSEVASQTELRFALGAVIISTLIFAAAVPFARRPLGQVPAFIPVYVSTFIICDVITAVLLFGQFHLSRTWALLILAAAYLFTATVTLSYALMFPGLFSSVSLLAPGAQGSSAMYMFWHAGFPIAVIGYALTQGAGNHATRRSAHPKTATLAAILAVLAIVSGFTSFVIVGGDDLPVFIQGDRTTDLGHIVLLGVWILSFLALTVLWRRRPYTVIDLWLMASMCAWLFDIALAAVLNGGRYDLGWYAGRIYGLLATSVLLLSLLIKNGNYYAYAVHMSNRLNAANKVLAQQSLRIATDLRRFRGLLEAAPDPMVVVDHGGHIALSNLQAETQFGYVHDELVGRQMTSIIPDGFNEHLVTGRRRWTDGEPVRKIGASAELRGRRKDGSSFPIEIMLSPLESTEGELVTVAMRDITSRKQVEAELLQKVEQLNRSNAELEQFAYVASHDLQEPLRMVASYMKLLSGRYKGKLDSDADEFIGFAVDGASRMQRLIQDLLAYSRVSSKGRAFSATSSENALQEALRNLRSAISESGAVVTHDVLPIVVADELQLAQLFQNLVGNAIKYQNPGIPRVHIAVAATSDQKWTFSVRDNGLGIAAEHFGTIFGMFQRLHGRAEFDGTGIGLAICKKIVERHGGHISVESKLGLGSNFRFALPRGGEL